MPEFTEKQKERIALATAVIDEAEKESPETLTERLDEKRADFLAELDGIDETQAAYSPGESQWSIGEVCRHMANAVRATGMGIRALAQGLAPTEKEPVEMGVLDPDPGNFEAVRQSVEEAFDSCVDAMQALKGDPNSEACILHPYFGDLNCQRLAAFNLLHINVHVAQLQRIKSTDGFPAAE